MIHVAVHLTPHQVDEIALREKVVVVADVLRAGTTVTAALHNGAREVIPTPTVEAAAKVSGNLAGGVTLRAGERNGRMIEGFQLGNSPLEYTQDRVRGKAIVFSSTNGSPVFVKARHARKMAVCSFVNISAVARFVQNEGTDCEILCAGNGGGFCLEDAVCAGMLIELLSVRHGLELEMDDAGVAAHRLYKSSARSLPRLLKNTENGRYLNSIGHPEDVLFCAAVDTIPVVPLLDGTVLRLQQDGEKSEPATATE